MTSCLSGLVRVGGVTCRPVCRGWLGCYVPSCLSGLVRVGGVTCRPVCRGWLGWGVLRDVLSVGVG